MGFQSVSIRPGPNSGITKSERNPVATAPGSDETLNQNPAKRPGQTWRNLPPTDSAGNQRKSKNEIIRSSKA
jgi:hypothetical protein